MKIICTDAIIMYEQIDGREVKKKNSSSLPYRSIEGIKRTKYSNSGSKTGKTVFIFMVLIYTLKQIYVIFFAIKKHILKI